MVHQKKRMLGGALVALALVGLQAARADDKKMILTRPFKANTVTTYKATIKANVQGMDITLEQTAKETIKTVKDNGTVVVLHEDLGGTMTLNGTPQEQKAGPPSTETRDKLGKLVDYAHEAVQGSPFSPEMEKLMASLSDTFLTEKEVAEGDSWETVFDNPASKDNKVKVKTIYQGIEKVGGMDLWKFKQTAEPVVNADGSKMAYEAITWINPKDGLMEKAESKVKDAPTQIGPVDISFAIKRVNPANTADSDKEVKKEDKTEDKKEDKKEEKK